MIVTCIAAPLAPLVAFCGGERRGGCVWVSNPFVVKSGRYARASFVSSFG